MTWLWIAAVALAGAEAPDEAENVEDVVETASAGEAGLGPDWVLGGSGFYVAEGRRVLRGVGVARGHRFLMDARKAARPVATEELEGLVRRFGSELTVAYSKTATGEGDANVMSELAGLADAFVAYRQRLLEEIDAEHMTWQGRDDDAYWAMAELDLAELREYVEKYADLGPYTRGWALEHLDATFDAAAAP